MENCSQGQRNAQDIQKLFDLVESRNSELLSMRADITEIKTLLQVKIEHIDAEVKRNKEEIKEHLADSKERIQNVDKNTDFRRVSIWVFGVIVTRFIFELFSFAKGLVK